MTLPFILNFDLNNFNLPLSSGSDIKIKTTTLKKRGTIVGSTACAAFCHFEQNLGDCQRQPTNSQI